MKKIYNILFVLLAGLSFVACTNEVDDVFDKSSAERIQEAINADMKMLVDAPNGWLMEYYGASKYGGYNMFVKFNADNTVTAANEFFDEGTRATSHFKLEQSQGVLLSFDEYNEIFHIFSDPDNMLQVGDKGKGFEGDFEFRVIKAEADRFELQGKKHGQKIVMTRLAEDFNWDNYFKKVEDMENLLSYKTYAIDFGGEAPLTIVKNNRTFTYHDAETDNDVVIPFIVTDQGLKFKKPIVIGTDSITMLTPAADETWKTDGKGWTVNYVLPTLVEQLTDPNTFWSFKKGKMSKKAAAYFAEAEKASASEGEDVKFIAFGVNPNAANLGWGVFFRSGNYMGMLLPEVTPIDGTHLALTMKGYDGNGQYYYNIGYKYITNGILRGTFELSTDNPKNPSYIRLTRTDASAPGEWMDVFPGLDLYDAGE